MWDNMAVFSGFKEDYSSFSGNSDVIVEKMYKHELWYMNRCEFIKTETICVNNIYQSKLCCFC